MGLVRAPPGSLGGTAYVLARHPAPLEPDPRRAAPSPMDQAHLIEAMDARAAALRRDTRRLEDRPAGHGHPRPGTEGRAGQLRPGGQALRGHRRAGPPRRGNRKGSVEAAVRLLLGPVVAHPQRRAPRRPRLSTLDRFGAGAGPAGDAMRQRRHRPCRAVASTTVGELADAEPLLDLPSLPFPATITVERPVDDNATVGFRGNRYSVPPGLSGVVLQLRHRLGAAGDRGPQPFRGPSSSPTALAPAGASTLSRPRHRTALDIGGPRRLHHGAALSTPRPTGHRGRVRPGRGGPAARLLEDDEVSCRPTRRYVDTWLATTTTRHDHGKLPLPSGPIDLAYLRIGRAAEALPAELDTQQGQAGPHRMPLAATEVEVSATEIERRRQASSASLAALALPPGGLRLRRPAELDKTMVHELASCGSWRTPPTCC